MGKERGLILRSLAGQTLGKYLVFESLGRGGMAQVYRAYHPQLDRYVAIKVLRPDLVDDETFLARFQREARAVAALRHPNIVQVYDFDVYEETYYMVMELLEGDTLKTWLHAYRSRGERMPIAEAVRIVLDILSGLAYAHSQGMIHRDIKPANILITRHGEAVLADFGIAQIVGSTQHTAVGALMGTLSYIAPEQGLKGCSDVRSDIYSLGVVLYEMLTMRTPFEAETPLAVLIRHLNEPLTPPRELDSEIPEPIESVVIRALNKSAEERFQSAEEMAQVLQQACAEAGIEIPAQVPLHSSCAIQAPSSVAVVSGPARGEIADVKFSTEATLAGLPQAALSQAAEARQRRRRVGGAILRGAAFFLVSNMATVTVAAMSDRWFVFATGWPIELLLVGVAMCIIMSVTACIWLLIPVGILLGNGLLLSYTSLTGRWHQWRTLWPIELWLVLCVVVVTLWLSKEDDRAQRLSHWLGRVLGWLAAAWSLLLAVIATVV